MNLSWRGILSNRRLHYNTKRKNNRLKFLPNLLNFSTTLSAIKGKTYLPVVHGKANSRIAPIFGRNETMLGLINFSKIGYNFLWSDTKERR